MSRDEYPPLVDNLEVNAVYHSDAPLYSAIWTRGYVENLWTQRMNGAIVTRRSWSGAQKNMCHDNAARWVTEHPGHRVIRGWLCFDLTVTKPHMRFTAHSVVADESGALVDITAAQLLGEHPFIPANLPSDVFDELVLRLTMQTGGAHLEYASS
jgi:hypothetical protein